MKKNKERLILINALIIAVIIAVISVVIMDNRLNIQSTGEAHRFLDAEQALVNYNVVPVSENLSGCVETGEAETRYTRARGRLMCQRGAKVIAINKCKEKEYSTECTEVKKTWDESTRTCTVTVNCPKKIAAAVENEQEIKVTQVCDPATGICTAEEVAPSQCIISAIQDPSFGPEDKIRKGSDGNLYDFNGNEIKNFEDCVRGCVTNMCLAECDMRYAPVCP